MNRIIKSEAEYIAIMASIEAIMDMDTISPEDEKKLEDLVSLVEKYEAEQYPILIDSQEE